MNRRAVLGSVQSGACIACLVGKGGLRLATKLMAAPAGKDVQGQGFSFQSSQSQGNEARGLSVALSITLYPFLPQDQQPDSSLSKLRVHRA